MTTLHEQTNERIEFCLRLLDKAAVIMAHYAAKQAALEERIERLEELLGDE